jgi:hypothetical protein
MKPPGAVARFIGEATADRRRESEDNTMRRSKLFPLFVVILLAAGSAVSAGNLDGQWLHVLVEESGDDQETVRVNLPLQLAHAVLPTLDIDHELRDGKVFLDDVDMHGVDLRQILAALRDTPDAEFVKVRSEDETVRVAKENGFLVVLADETDGERVRVTVPLDVIDALLSGSDPNELDLVAALEALANYSGGDLVTVESDDTMVRVWIDSQSGD